MENTSGLNNNNTLLNTNNNTTTIMNVKNKASIVSSLLANKNSKPVLMKKIG
jgi:hypothetical protein